MIRSLRLALCAVLAVILLPVAQSVGQNIPAGQPPAYTPPAGVEMEIVLYPITSFRGNAQRFRASREVINTPLMVESIYLVRGIWLVCSEQYYYGRCVRISGSQQAVNPPFPVRSIRLIGDTGPTFVESPQARAGSDVPTVVVETQRIDVATRADPTPVVAPGAAEGGIPGTNPSLAGRAVEFFAAPAQGGNRVLACSQIVSDNPNPRCVQAAADGFCVAEGFRDSGWREIEVVGNRAYLVNVLCKQASDSDAAKDNSGFRLPFFGG